MRAAVRQCALRVNYMLISAPAKTFEYITPTLDVLPPHLKESALLSSRSFHLLSSPKTLIGQVSSLLGLRLEEEENERPLIIWEPLPAACVPENFENFIQACKVVDIFSPNHVELNRIFGVEGSELVNRDILERHALAFVEAGIGVSADGAFVLRAGEDGCLVASKSQAPTWLPPFYDPGKERDSNQVVDPTGAGNAFLGSFAIGFLKTESLTEAACYGNVGASFALEQTGVPALDALGNGKELWNGIEVSERLKSYVARLE
jgi:sugar/nucleoside kinase (ribokinase family)